MEASIIESMEDSITKWWHTASVGHADKRGARLEEIAVKWISRRRPHAKISELMPHILPILERLRAAYLLHLPENWASRNSWVGPCEAEVENNRRDKKRWEASHGKLPKPAEAAAKDARAQVAATIRALATVRRTASGVAPCTIV